MHSTKEKSTFILDIFWDPKISWKSGIFGAWEIPKSSSKKYHFWIKNRYLKSSSKSMIFGSKSSSKSSSKNHKISSNFPIFKIWKNYQIFINFWSFLGPFLMILGKFLWFFEKVVILGKFDQKSIKISHKFRILGKFCVCWTEIQSSKLLLDWNFYKITQKTRFRADLGL